MGPRSILTRARMLNSKPFLINTLAVLLSVTLALPSLDARTKKGEKLLKEGKLADFVVLDADIFKVDPMKIKDIKVEKTYLGGKLVYSRD